MHDIAKTRLSLLNNVSEKVRQCTNCELHKGRTNTVFGFGSPRADIVFFGEGPGVDEDAQGLPFVGRAGKLLTNMIVSMGLTRDDVYILNSVKCRPPNNRKPEPEEVESCKPYYQMQLEIIKPLVIVALGATAIETLCGVGSGITKRRGKWEKYEMVSPEELHWSCFVMPTFHPAYLLRTPSAKTAAWNDLQEVKKRVDGLKI